MWITSLQDTDAERAVFQSRKGCFPNHNSTCPEPTLTNPWVLVGLCPFTPHKIHHFHPYHYYHITHYYYYLVLFHFHYSLLLLLLMTCHLSSHQRHSRLYNVTRLLYILGQSLTTFFSIVLTKSFAVETSTFLSVSSLLRDCSKICPVLPMP